VTFPANEQARVSGVKKFFDMANVPSEREFESFLRASGLSRKQSRGVIACGYKALAAAQEEDDEDESAEWDSLIASIKQATEEMKRGIARQQQVSDEESAVYSSLIESIKQATEDMKAGFDPAQARAPAGNSAGGQWSDTGGGGGGGGGSPRQPFPTRRPQNLDWPSGPDEPGLGHPLSPLDFIGAGGVARVLKPVASEIVSGAVAARNAARLMASGIAKEKLTDHGGIRVGERAVSNREVEDAIRTAKATGNVTTKLGKYRTPQNVYKGSNGVTVHIETQGRNVGKIITLYRH